MVTSLIWANLQISFCFRGSLQILADKYNEAAAIPFPSPDKTPPVTIINLVAILSESVIFIFADHYKILTLFTVFIFGIAAFGTVPGLQLHMLNTAKEAPTLASTLNIAAFNLGNALGAYIGGVVINLKIGGGLPAVPLFASLVTVVGILFTIWGAQQQKSNYQQSFKK